MEYEIIDTDGELNLYKFIVANGEIVLVWAKEIQA
jgi:hypothetical protein